MNDESIAPLPSETEESEKGIWGRMMDVLVAPSDAFHALAVQPIRASNWALPVLLVSLMAVTHVVVTFSMPSLQHQLIQAREKQIDDMVAKGKLTPEAAKMAAAQSEKFGFTFMKIAGSVGAVVTTFARLFLLAIVLWLLTKWAFKREVEYMKFVEAVGLAGVVHLVGGPITLLLVLAMDSMMASPSLALLVQPFDPAKMSHRALAALNIFAIWETALLVTAVSALGAIPWGKAAIWAAALWVFWKTILVVAPSYLPFM